MNRMRSASRVSVRSSDLDAGVGRSAAVHLKDRKGGRALERDGNALRGGLELVDEELGVVRVRRLEVGLDVVDEVRAPAAAGLDRGDDELDAKFLLRGIPGGHG